MSTGSMKKALSLLLLVGTGFGAWSCKKSVDSEKKASKASSWEAYQKEKGSLMIEMETSKGVIKIELYPEKAPQTVANFMEYVNDGFYSNTIFHRVIDGFMIQGGGFESGFKEKKTRSPIKNESSNGLANQEMTIAMARTNEPNSATAQFFINLVDNPYLNGSESRPGYAVFGKVIEGKEVVKAIGQARTATKDYFENVPVEEIVIKSVKISPNS